MARPVYSRPFDVQSPLHVPDKKVSKDMVLPGDVSWGRSH